MLKFLYERSSQRKLRLFGCACCRRAWDLLSEARHRRGVEVVERYAAELATEQDLHVVRGETSFPPNDSNWAAAAAYTLTAPYAHNYIPRVADYAAAALAESTGQPERAEREVQCGLLRDIIGNPFRPVFLEPAWLTSTVRQLGEAAYEE